MVLWPGRSAEATLSVALPAFWPTASACTDTLDRLLAATLASRRALSRGLGSKAWTVPVEPTSRAAMRVKTPALAPTSMTHIPGASSFDIANISLGSYRPSTYVHWLMSPERWWLNFSPKYHDVVTGPS